MSAVIRSNVYGDDSSGVVEGGDAHLCQANLLVTKQAKCCYHCMIAGLCVQWVCRAGVCFVIQ